MSKIENKFKTKIQELIKKRDLIPDEFWVRAEGGEHFVIWFMDRQKPSVEVNYSFDQERFGITKDGLVIWGFDSGCSCPNPWDSSDNFEGYSTREWKEFEVNPETAFDADWKDECYKNLEAYLFLISKRPDPKKVVALENAEIRRYMIKRVGYGKIKESVKAKVLHRDGHNELLEFNNGEMYVKVRDSSTDREYLLFVEGHHETCRSAIAWTFGLSESEYCPILET